MAANHRRMLLAGGTLAVVWALTLLLVVASASYQLSQRADVLDEFSGRSSVREKGLTDYIKPSVLGFPEFVVDKKQSALAITVHNFSEVESPLISTRNEGLLAQVDSDGNGYVDTFRLDAAAEVRQGGDYTVIASLLTSQKELILQSREVVELSTSIENFSLSFDASQLAYLNYTGSIPMAFIEIRDAESQHAISSKMVNLRGGLINASRLEAQTFFLTNHYDDMLIDTNDDDATDAIRLAAAIYVKVPGEYAICGTLNDKNGTLAEVVSVLLDLKRGLNFFNTIFKGTPIINNGNDGPYLVSLRLTDPTGQKVLVQQSSPYETKPYKISDFGKAAVYIEGVSADKAEDTNNDGKYDFLTAELNLDVAEPGTYQVFGYLYHGLQFVSMATINGDFEAGRHSVPLRFSGAEVEKTGVKDSFTLRSIDVFDGWGVYTADHVLARKELDYSTANYDATRFSSQQSVAPTQTNLNTAVAVQEVSILTFFEEPKVLVGVIILAVLGALSAKKMSRRNRTSS